MTITSHAQILRYHQAAVKLRLGANREALLNGIPPSLTSAIPTEPDRGAQLLNDLNRLNEIGALPDGSVPLQTWLSNAQALTGPRREAEVFHEAFNPSSAGKPRLPALGIAAAAILALVALALTLHLAKPTETTGPDVGTPTSPTSAPIIPPPLPPATSSAPPIASPSTPATTLPPPKGSPAVAAPPPPLASSPSTATTPPPGCKSGTASRNGAFWSLGIPRQDLGPAQFVYLDPSPRPEALSGVQPTCSLLPATGTAQCTRSDKAHDISIGDTAPWRAPCP